MTDTTPDYAGLIERLDRAKVGLCSENPSDYMAFLTVKEAMEAATTLRALEAQGGRSDG